MICQFYNVRKWLKLCGMVIAREQVSRAERKKRELRRDIIDTAFECFAEQGYHATGIADIAARLGIGHGTFYRYFHNKRDIVEHVISDLIERITNALTEENAPEAVNNLGDYRKQSARIGEALAGIFMQDPRIPRMLLFEAPGIDRAMSDRILGFFDMATELTAAYLRHGVELGYLRRDLDVANTARAINGMILSSAMAIIQNPEVNQRDLSKAIRRVMYDGIASR